MFIRQKKNKSGSVSVEIIAKEKGKYEVIKTIGQCKGKSGHNCTLGGYAIGYDIFEGNIYEGRTLIPVIEKVTKKFNLGKPVVVADAGLMSSDNIKADVKLMDGQTMSIEKPGNIKLIISYSDKRAAKDAHNRNAVWNDWRNR